MYNVSDTMEAEHPPQDNQMEEGQIVEDQIDIARDTTEVRERRAARGTSRRRSPSPSTALMIPERDDDDWTDARLERVPRDSSRANQASLVSEQDESWFKGMDQNLSLHGRFSTPDEEGVKELIRDMNPKLAKELFDQQPCSPIPGPTPSNRELNQLENSQNKLTDSTTTTPAAQSSSVDMQRPSFYGSFDIPASFTSISDPQSGDNSRSATMSAPLFERLTAALFAHEALMDRIQSLRQSQRGQQRPAATSPSLLEQSERK
jgi:hypothetical protein